MKFSAETGLGKVWIDLIRDGKYTEAQVPKLGDLRGVVHAALLTKTDTPTASAH